MTRAAAWAPKTWAFRLSRSIRSQPASVTSSHSAHPPAIEVSPPALLTQTSSRPKALTAAAAAAVSWATVGTSVGWTTARRPMRLDLGADLLEVVAAPGGEDDVGPLIGEGEGDGPPEAAARAGDEAGLPGE